jgi:hypothetical protein
VRWRTKARVQRLCARLPFGESLYYGLQRRFGSLRQPPDPTFLLSEAARIARRLRDAGFPVAGARIMEIGTGRRLDVPIGFFLAGARSVVTVDLHRYLRPELVLGALAAMRERPTEYRAMFASLTDDAALAARWAALVRVGSVDELLRVASIEYRAPADATRSGLDAGSVDIQTSYTVLEHIPRPVLVDILVEARRVLAPGGVAFHHIDPSDHFAHEDETISMVNFLQFPDAEWDRLAGNQFGYHNRLRVDEFRDVYREAGHTILDWDVHVDPRSLEALRGGLPVDGRFRGRSREVLAATVVQALSRPE